MVMKKAVQTFGALGLALLLVSAGTPQQRAWADESTEDPGEMARESIELMMKSLELLIESIPQYEAPYMNENGDIIIRRKRKPGEPPYKDPPEDEQGEDEEDYKKI